MKASTKKNNLLVCLAALSAVMVFLTSMACLSEAASYPEQDVTFIVPFRPGGGLDAQARILAPFIKKYLPNKVNVVIENQPAAGGKVGALKVFQAKPNGYTIGILSPNSMALLNAKGEIGKTKLGDLTYLCRTTYAPYMLTLSSRSQFKNISEMKGQRVKFGGTTAVVFQAAMIAQQLGVKMVFVTYDGFPESSMAAMRGDVDVTFFNWDSGIKHVEASEGKLKTIFIASESRLAELPNLPTAKEAGLALDRDVMSVMAAHNVVLAPAGLPPAVKGVLEKAVQKAINDPELVAQMRKANYFVKTLTPKETREYVQGIAALYMKYKDMIETVK